MSILHVERETTRCYVRAIEFDATMETLSDARALAEAADEVEKPALDYVADRIHSALSRSHPTCRITRTKFDQSNVRHGVSEEAGEAAWRAFTRHLTA